MATILLKAFSNAFSWKKFCVFNYFLSNLTEICSWGLNWQYANIDSGNGMVPNRWQATTWTNVDQGTWCHIVLLGHNWLKKPHYSTDKSPFEVDIESGIFYHGFTVWYCNYRNKTSHFEFSNVWTMHGFCIHGCYFYFTCQWHDPGILSHMMT